MDGPSADLLHMLAILLSLLRKGSRIWRESELPQAFFLHASAAAGVCFRPQKHFCLQNQFVSPCQRHRGRFFFDQQRTFQTQLVLFYVHAAACFFCRAGTPRDLNPQNVSTNYISKRSIRLQEEHPTTRGAPIPRTISYTPFQPHPLANYVYIYTGIHVYIHIYSQRFI